uniref:PDEase domain-containing protein n=1 Tax=Macrostomum lignano TaxID=282301 RepID=A0A1I8JN01_9PLAT
MANNDAAPATLQLLAACKLKLHQLLELVQLDRGWQGGDRAIPDALGRLLEKVFLDRSRGRSFGELDEETLQQASGRATAAHRRRREIVPYDDGEAQDAENAKKTHNITSAYRRDVVANGRASQRWLCLSFTLPDTARPPVGSPRNLRLLQEAAVPGTRPRRRAGGDATAPQPPPVPIGAPALAYLEAASPGVGFLIPSALPDLTGDRPVRNMGCTCSTSSTLSTSSACRWRLWRRSWTWWSPGISGTATRTTNCTHSGADVAQSCCYIVAHGTAGDWLSDVELLALTARTWALVYNDRSVLESHHVSAVFRRMQEAKCNPLKGLAQPEYRQFRSLVIDMVLATTCVRHEGRDPVPGELPRVDILAYVAARGRHQPPRQKSWSLHQRWTSQLNEEFFAQGDREKQLGPAVRCATARRTMVASSQVRSGGIGDPHPAGVPDEGVEVSDIVRGGQLVHPLGWPMVFVPRLVEVRAEGDVMLRGLLSYAQKGQVRHGRAALLYSVQLFSVELSYPSAHGLTSAPIAGWTTPEQQVGVFTEEPGADLLDASRAGELEGSGSACSRAAVGRARSTTKGGRAVVQVSQEMDTRLGFVLKAKDDAALGVSNRLDFDVEGVVFPEEVINHAIDASIWAVVSVPASAARTQILNFGSVAPLWRHARRCPREARGLVRTSLPSLQVVMRL